MSALQFDFSGHRAIVTGATKGMGREIALALARAGCDVGATGRDVEDLRSLKSEIELMGRRCETYAADLSREDEPEMMARYFCTELDPVDILVNNAGISFLERITDMEMDHWNATLNVNLRAPAFILKVVGKHMAERKRGAIVNVASLSSVTGLLDHGSYCASKYGLQGLTKVAALEFGPSNVRVNSVGPTVVLTPMGQRVWGDPEKGDPMKAKIPLGRFVEMEEVVNTVLFLASDAAGMIHGELVLVDGGYMAGK